MIGCICGFVVEGLVLLGALGLSAVSFPLAKVYNSWCRKKHEHNCKRHKNQVVPTREPDLR